MKKKITNSHKPIGKMTRVNDILPRPDQLEMPVRVKHSAANSKNIRQGLKKFAQVIENIKKENMRKVKRKPINNP